MSSRNILNLVLLLVIGILVVFVIYEPGVEKAPAKILSQIDKHSINKISIKRLATKEVILTKQDGNWRMQTPYPLPANSFKAESILDLSGSNYEASYELKDLDLKKYGLDKPRATITLNDKYVFEFGSTESLKNRRYIKYKDKLYVANDVFYHRFSLNETDYLDHALLAGIKTINKLELPGFTLTMQDGNWNISPIPKDYSNDQANELIENWKLTQAIQITPYQAQKSAKSIKLYADNSDKPVVFHIIQTEKDFFLARPDLAIKYELTNDKAKDLLELPPKVEATLPESSGNETLKK